MRVLVIDDERDVLLLCRLNLEIAGHEVLEALDGKQGMELALRHRPDLIVLDVILARRTACPSCEGLRITRRPRGRRWCSSQPGLSPRIKPEDGTRAAPST